MKVTRIDSAGRTFEQYLHDEPEVVQAKKRQEKKRATYDSDLWPEKEKRELDILV